MVQLRDYQLLSIDELTKSFKQGHKKCILTVPTGGGKTTVAAEMIRRSTAKGKKILFLAHRKELVEQAKDRLHVFGIKPGVIMAGWKHVDRLVNVASQQTLIRRKLPPADVIFVDECHHSISKGFKDILNQYPDAFIIGLTATPYRLDGKGLGDIYTQIVAPINVADLTEQGYLVPASYYGPRRDMSSVKLTGGDYNSKDLYDKMFSKTELLGEVVENYKRFANGTKAIVFNVNVEHSNAVCQQFLESGISCAHVDGETPALLRNRILTDFRHGKYNVLCNVNILTEGFDLPAIETVILNRATKSKALYFQMVGRGLRPAPGKDHCTVIDQGGNVYQHGPVDMEEEYTLDSKKKKKKLGAPPMKECPKCYLLQNAGAQKCKECGHQFTEALLDRQLPKEEFEDITHLVASKPIIPPHLRKPWREMSKEELEEFAAIKNFKKGWVWHQLRNQETQEEAA